MKSFLKGAADGQHLHAWAFAIFGAAVYLIVIHTLLPGSTTERPLAFIYNYYFLALIDGRFDVPVRIMTIEGLYDSEGRAFVPYGLAPLATRALAWPFLDLKQVSIAPYTIWLFAAGGTAVYQFIFADLVRKFAPGDDWLQHAWAFLLAAVVWCCSPGLLLLANDAVYHEPIAAAYFFSACFLWLLTRAYVFDRDLSKYLPALAAASGLTVHARPHLAVGMYAVVGLLCIFFLIRNGLAKIRSIASALSILFAFAVLFLAVNEARFGEALYTNQAWDGNASIVYGTVYWNIENSETPRVKAYLEHGQFNIARIAPNLLVYLFDVPAGSISEAIDSSFRWLTRSLGYIRNGGPRIGIVFLWLPWIFLIAKCATIPQSVDRCAWIGVATMSIGALFVLSFGTVDFRYRVDLWPLLASIVILVLPRYLTNLDDTSKTNGFMPILIIGSTLVSFISIWIVFKFYPYANFIHWSFDKCAELVAAKVGLGPEAVDRLCAL